MSSHRHLWLVSFFLATPLLATSFLGFDLARHTGLTPGAMTHLVGIEDRKHARSMIKMVRCVDALADMEPETNTVRLFLEDGASLDRATVWCGRRTGDVH